MIGAAEQPQPDRDGGRADVQHRWLVRLGQQRVQQHVQAVAEPPRARGQQAVAARHLFTRSTQRRFTATRATAEARSDRLASSAGPRTDHRPAVQLQLVADGERAGAEGSGHAPCRCPGCEGAVHPEPDPPVGSGPGSRDQRAAARPGARSMPGTGLRRHRHGRHLAEAGGGHPRPGSASTAAAGPGSARSLRVTTRRPCRMPSASSAARCSSAAGASPRRRRPRTARPAPARPRPACWRRTARARGRRRRPALAGGSAVQAKPRSMVMPRRRSSAHRSGSMPVSARTSVDLPWSTWPAVATTCISRRPRRRASRTADPHGQRPRQRASSVLRRTQRRSSRQRPRSTRPTTAGSPRRSGSA